MNIWLVIAIVVVVILFWTVGIYNKLISLRNACSEGYSTMDVYMKKRFDLIPNLVETVKGFAAHERETLDAVISARNKAVNATTPQAAAEGENQVMNTLGRLFALSESYPDLKSDQNFMDLQRQLQAVEQDIANARKFYNATVKMFNTAIMVVPNVIIANMFGFKPNSMFEIDSEVERKNVQVSFK